MEKRDAATVADRVVVSYRAADADPDSNDSGFDADHLVHERVRTAPFRAYLRRIHGGDVAVGDEWAEFVNCGCGTTTDVVLRVRSIEGGTALGEDTEIEFVSASGSGPS